MRLEAVLVCVDYADFLRETLPRNLHLFDRMVVVTSYADQATPGVCKRFGVDCRQTDVGTAQGDVFNKGRMIDYGLGYLSRSDWVVHLDADMVLPPTARDRLGEAKLDPDCVYGIDRVNCVGYAAWQKFASNLDATHPWHQHCVLATPPFPLASRIVLREHGGYVPIGFFQLWNAARRPYRYPLAQGDAEHTDVLFSLQWPLANRRLFPGIVGIHLESEPTRMGANWQGRTTRPFGPEPTRATPVPAYHSGPLAR